jgi:hypothetical protein
MWGEDLSLGRLFIKKYDIKWTVQQDSEPPMTYVCEPSFLSVILLGVASQIEIFGEAPQHSKAS